MPQLMPTEERKAIVSLSLLPKLIDKLSETARQQSKTRSELAAEIFEQVLK